VSLPEGVSGRALVAAAREEGVLLSAGADYEPDQADVSAIRVSVARGTSAELEKALEIAGACARELARQAARQKKGRAKAARDASDAKEAALIQI
jgi:DNA-binding transcriptional MocR family regulator